MRGVRAAEGTGTVMFTSAPIHDWRNTALNVHANILLTAKVTKSTITNSP